MSALIDPRIKVAIGGPAYDMRVNARHCDTVAWLMFGLMTTPNQSGGPRYRADVFHRHSSILVENRDSMLRECYRNHIDLFISIDSDVGIDSDGFGDSVATAIAAVQMTIDEGIAYTSFPVRQGDGAWNVKHADGKSFETLPKNRVLTAPDVGWCAQAFTIYNVPLYEDWINSESPLYQNGWHPGEKRWIGEDCYHSLECVKRGLKFAVVTGVKTVHGRIA